MRAWPGSFLLLMKSAVLFVPVTMALPATAQSNYAVIVGVSKYPSLPASTGLKGPGNDATMIRAFLLSRSPVLFKTENVAVLADDLPGAVEPTRANILSALEKVAAQASSGDFVYLHFSGHGYQLPSNQGSETDGFDEVLLPKDTRPWDEASRSVPNVITDDELGRQIKGLTANGAFVWAVFDACHSGTATRAAPPAKAKLRKISPEEVGMPRQAMFSFPGIKQSGWTTQDLPIEMPQKNQPGGYVAFFAAQSNETTPEMPLPTEDGMVFGLFTYTLFSKLSENPAVTFRQLGDSVLQHYASMNRTSSTPLFEGDLDRTVFRVRNREFVRQWPINASGKGATVQAGLIDGLTRGSRLAVLTSPLAQLQDAVSFVEVTDADTFSSRVAFADLSDSLRSGHRKAHSHSGPSSEITLPARSVARLVSRTYDFQLKVARPPADPRYARAIEMVDTVLSDIANQIPRRFSIGVVGSSDTADVRFAVLTERDINPSGLEHNQAKLWFLPESGEAVSTLRQTPPSLNLGSTTEPGFRAALIRYLERIYRAKALFKISQTRDYSPSDIELKLTLQSRGTGSSREVVASRVTVASPGDRLRVEVTNNTRSSVDLNIIYIGSDYSIGHLGGERMHSLARFSDASLEFTDTSYGQEYLLLIVTDARPLTNLLDLRFLGQEGLRPATRNLSANTIEDLLVNIAAQAPARSIPPLRPTSSLQPRGAIFLFPIRTVPREPK